MLKIPIEILNKNRISTNHLEDELGVYETYLYVTDKILLEGLELLLSDPDNFQENLSKFAITNQEVFKYRKIAKQELNR